MEPISGTADDLQNQIWSSTVMVFVDRAEGLPSSKVSDDNDNDDDDDDDGSNDSKPPSEAYIRLRLGNEKWISKRSRNNRWLESFDFHLFDVDQQLEVAVWHLRQMYAVTTIDLELLQRERMHRVWAEFKDAGKPGRILLIIQISNVNVMESISDYSDDWKENLLEAKDLQLRYGWRQTLHNFKDVGHLTVIVYEAMNLVENAAATAKIGTFCVVQLGSSRLQTQIETNAAASPSWNKIFTLHVKDMTSVLELIACSKDDSQEIVVLATTAIPLLRIKDGIKRWFALRGCKSQGTCPQILLEMSLAWNPLRALGNIFQPREREQCHRQQQQKQQIFVQNVQRIRNVCDEIERIHNSIQNLFEWKSPLRTMIALIFWVASCVFVKFADIPRHLAFMWLAWGCLLCRANNKMAATATHNDCQLVIRKGSGHSSTTGYQEALDTVEHAVARLQKLATRIQNIFNFTIPTLTWMAGFMLVFAVFLLCLVPIRWMLLAWGAFKFTKRIVRPKAVIDSSLMNFLVRVPDNTEVEKYRELPT